MIFTLVIMEIMNDDFLYYGLVLTEEAKDYIINFVNDAMPGLDLTNSKLHCHHCTLLHRTQYYNHRDLYNTLEVLRSNNEYFITIDAIGWNDKALAVRVSDVKAICANKTPHITVLTFGNGKPVDSNKINNWIAIYKPFKVRTYCVKIG